MKIFALTLVLIFVQIPVCAGELTDAVPYFSSSLVEEITGNATLQELVSSVISKKSLGGDGIIEKLWNMLVGDVRYCASYVLSIMGFCILSSCIKGSQIKLGGSLGEISYLVCYFVIAAFLSGVLSNAVNTARSCSDELETFIRMSLPAYIGIVSSSGINVAASQGIFLAMINVVSEYAGGYMIDAFFYIGLLTVIGNMSSGIKITKLISIARQVLFWILGLLLTVFAGMTALSGLSASHASNIGIRAVKYTIGHSIPLVGGFLADSTDLILASAGIFRGAFGTAGIVILAVLCIVPVLKLFVMGFMLKITAGLTEPFCDTQMCNTIYQVGQTVIHIMAVLLLMTVMFILSFAVLMSL